MLAYPPIVVRLLFDAEIAGAGASMSAASPAVARGRRPCDPDRFLVLCQDKAQTLSNRAVRCSKTNEQPSVYSLTVELPLRKPCFAKTSSSPI